MKKKFGVAGRQEEFVLAQELRAQWVLEPGEVLRAK